MKFLKYETRKFTIDYSKTAARIRKQHKIDLEQKLKNLESNLTSKENRKLYNHYKNELETIYDDIAEGIKIRRKCEWYEHGEKSTKFFSNLQKSGASKAEPRNLLLKKKKQPIPKKHPKTSKRSMKHFLNETSQKPVS